MRGLMSAARFRKTPLVVLLAVYLGTLFVVLAIDVVLASIFIAAGGQDPSAYGFLKIWMDRLDLRTCLEVLGAVAATGLFPLLIVSVWSSAKAVPYAMLLWGLLLAGFVAGVANRATQLIWMLAAGQGS